MAANHIPGPIGRLGQSTRGLIGRSESSMRVVRGENAAEQEEAEQRVGNRVSPSHSQGEALDEDVKELARQMEKVYARDYPKGLATVQGIHDGIFDLKVPHLMVLVDEINYTANGTAILQLKDGTGRIAAYISNTEMIFILEMLQPRRGDLKSSSLATQLSKGSILVLQGVSIFISRTNFCRYLNIVSSNLRRIISPFSSLPTTPAV
eukprot:gene6397-7052_t